MDKVRDKLGEAERRVGESEDLIRDHRATLHTLQVCMEALESRAEDSENRSRRNNLRVVGLLEGAEGQDAVAFTEHLLHTLLPGAVFSPHFAVERAHRTPPIMWTAGVPPYLYLPPVKFQGPGTGAQGSREGEAIKVAELRQENAKIMMFQDFSIDTQRLRRTFDHVKAQLRTKGLKYSMLFPARLRVVDDETTRYFTSPEEASHWIDTLPGAR